MNKRLLLACLAALGLACALAMLLRSNETMRTEQVNDHDRRGIRCLDLEITCPLSFSEIPHLDRNKLPRRISASGVIGTSNGVLTLYASPFAAEYRIDEDALRLRGSPEQQAKWLAEFRGSAVVIVGPITPRDREDTVDVALGSIAPDHIRSLSNEPDQSPLAVDVDDMESGTHQSGRAR